MWKSLFPSLTFTMPDWIPPLSTPTHQFNSDPPTYARVTSILRKMKSNGSACPLDQFSTKTLCLPQNVFNCHNSACMEIGSNSGCVEESDHYFNS